MPLNFLPYLLLPFPEIPTFMCFKLVSTTFYHIFISHQMITIQKLWKRSFHLNKYFNSQDIHIFVFPSSLLFLPVSHCLRGWLKINLRVYDVTKCLNMNFITHFVCHFEKEKRYDIETFSTDRVLNKEHFYWKIMHKMCTND